MYMYICICICICIYVYVHTKLPALTPCFKSVFNKTMGRLLCLHFYW